MRVLDIDMDFFLNKVALDVPFNKKRLSSTEYKAWGERKIRHYLQFNCGLSTNNPIKGKIVTEHREAFYFWRELINQSVLTCPFDVVHIDAHADMGLGDGAWAFIFEELLKMPVEERSYIERFKRKQKKFEILDSGNYLLYAIACRWINTLTYVTHPLSDGYDYIKDVMKDCDDNSGYIQLKRFLKPIDFYEDIINQDFICEPEVKFDIIKNYLVYLEPVLSNFDFIVFSQSPSYTPKTADFIIDIVKDYIKEV